MNVLDLCTGSGAIAIVIAKKSKSLVSATDISKMALDVARENAKNNNVKINFFFFFMFENLKKRARFDIIVSNPPYIRTLDIEGLDEEVKNYDPKLALDGGEDGLKFYRIIAEKAQAHLKNKGKLFLEIGKGQYSAVEKILIENGFTNISYRKDYSKIIRVVIAEYDKRRRNT